MLQRSLTANPLSASERKEDAEALGEESIFTPEFMEEVKVTTTVFSSDAFAIPSSYALSGAGVGSVSVVLLGSDMGHDAGRRRRCTGCSTRASTATCST
eukprot:2632320-Rhodomonas_salina.2